MTPRRRIRVDVSGEISVHRRPEGMLEIHRQYGLWIFSFQKEAVSPPKPAASPRRFEFYGISHLLEGHGFYWTPEWRRVGFEPGAAVFSLPGTIQDYGGDGTDYVEDSVCFSGPAADLLRGCGVIRQGIVQMGLERRLAPLFDIAAAPSRDAQIKANIYLQKLLVDLYLENKAGPSARPSPVALVMKTLADSPEQAWTVERMAELSGLSPSQFRRGFAAETGLHPKRYVDQFKMRLAAELLLSNGLSVREAAARVGYEDPYHFSRRFKQVMTIPPGEYRERMSLNHRASGG